MQTTKLAPVLRLADLIESIVEERAAVRLAKAQGRSRGPTSGIGELDNAIGGSFAPGLHIVQAAPGAGKTAFCLQVAACCRFPAVFISAEMSSSELFYRLIAQQTGSDLSELKSDDVDEVRLRRQAEVTSLGLPYFMIIDASVASAPLELVGNTIKQLTAQTGVSPLVVVDSIQAWAKSAGGAYVPEYDAVSRTVRMLVELASSARVPILGVAQRNRAGQERGGLFASKGSGDIEYAAESVLELGRTKDGAVDAWGDIAVRLDIHKNRHGTAGGSVSLKFNGSRQIFRPARSLRA